MARSFQVPILAGQQTPLTFPNRCVCCGAPRQTESNLQINRLVQRGRKQKQISIKYRVPHCARCARGTQIIFLAGCLPFGLGLLLIGGLIFGMVTFGAAAVGLDNYGQPNNANSLVLGAAAGLVAGLAGAFVFELIARLILLPFFGRALYHAPLLTMQLLNNADHIAGLTARPDPQTLSLQLTFFNDEIANEFEKLNPPLPGIN